MPLVPKAAIASENAEPDAKRSRVETTNGTNGVSPEHKLHGAVLEELGREVMASIRKHVDRMNGPDNAVPAKPTVKPGEIAKSFGEKPPEKGRPFADILRDFETKVLPGATHWQHPRFFAYYPSAASVPSILSESCIAVINSVGLQWAANPVGTELEVVVMDWLAQLIGVSGPFLHTSGKGGGLIRNTAGEAMMDMCVAARIQTQRRLLKERHGDKFDKEDAYHADSSKLVLYCSDQAHFSGPKAARVAGMRSKLIPARRLADGNYGITVDDVRKVMKEDVAQGLVPCFVLLNHGSTNTCGYDDAEGMAALIEEFHVWVHCDAAFAGSFWVLPQFQGRTEVIQRNCTSFNFNGSKAFLCGFDSAFYWVKDRKPLMEAFSATGAFMAPADGDGIYDPEFKDWSVPLGRRFRSLRIWMVLSYFGAEGMRKYLGGVVEQADWLRKQIDEHKGLGQAVHTDLGLVCLTAQKGKGDVTKQLATQLQSEGMLCFPSVIDGTPHLRLALGGSNTTMDEVHELWAAIKRGYAELEPAPETLEVKQAGGKKVELAGG